MTQKPRDCNRLQRTFVSVTMHVGRRTFPDIIDAITNEDPERYADPGRSR